MIVSTPSRARSWITTCFATMILSIISAPSVEAQQTEVRFVNIAHAGGFGEELTFADLRTSLVTDKNHGPGYVGVWGGARAIIGPSIKTRLIGLAAQNTSIALALATLEVEMTSSLSGPQSFGAHTRKNQCNLLEGAIVDFLQRLQEWGIPTSALIDAINSQLEGSLTLGVVACSTTYSRQFENLREGDWNLTISAKGSASYLGQASGSAGGLGFQLEPQPLIFPPDGDAVETTQYRFECHDGMTWNGIENRCVCDDSIPLSPSTHEDCRPVPANCGPRQIEQEGACIDCPPGTAPINNECQAIEGGPEDECPEGSPCFCATNLEHESCINCELVNSIIYHDGLPIGDPQDHIRCESIFAWTSGSGSNQAQFDCLFFDFLCWVSQGRVKTVIDPLDVPETRHLKACSEGLGWIPCGEPGYRELVPARDYLELLPECYVASNGVPITTCGTTLPDGSSGPDLLVEHPEIITTHPIAGEPIFLTFDVANRGIEAAPNATWSVQADTPDGFRTLTGVIGSLAAGDQRTFELSSDDLWFTPQEGPHTFRITVDHNNSLTELNENNNMRLMATLVTAGSTTIGTDLIANVTGTTVENPTVGQDVDVFVTVTNIGQTMAPESVLLLSVTNPAGQWLPETRDIGSLSPGQSVTEAITTSSDQAGSLWLTARADASFVVAEDNESNNEAFLGLHFAEPDACLACTSGAPDNGVGAIRCFPSWDGIEAEGDQYQCFGVRPDGTTCAPGGDHPNGWFRIGLRCPDPWTLCEGTHPDRCGIPDICPGTLVCN